MRNSQLTFGPAEAAATRALRRVAGVSDLGMVFRGRLLLPSFCTQSVLSKVLSGSNEEGDRVESVQAARKCSVRVKKRDLCVCGSE